MQIVKLKDVCIGKGEYGIAASAEEYSKNKTRYLRITDISDFGDLLDDDRKSISCSGCDKYLLHDNDIVFARTGNSTGRAFFYENKYGSLTYAGFLIKFHLDESKLNPKYMKYYTVSNTYKNWIANGPTGSTRGNMSEGDFANMPVFLPERKVQDGLVAIMEPIDDKIQNNNAIRANLNALLKLFYDYWFLQFDFPNNNGNPYKSSGGKMVYNKVLKRDIPEGWEVVKIKDIISHINTGLNPRQNFKLNNGNIKYITVKNLTTEGTIDFTSCDTIDDNALAKVHKRSDISKGDVLFASIAPLGRCVIIREDPKGWDINESVFSIRPKNKNLSEYLYMFFMSEYFIKKAEHSSTGSVFDGIRISVLEDMEIVIPPVSILNEFNKIISPILDLKYQNEIENQQLKGIYNFLLPLLMNGQIRISD